MSANAYPSYVGGYPIGAFIVHGKASLQTLIQRLRRYPYSERAEVENSARDIAGKGTSTPQSMPREDDRVGAKKIKQCENLLKPGRNVTPFRVGVCELGHLPLDKVDGRFVRRELFVRERGDPHPHLRATEDEGVWEGGQVLTTLVSYPCCYPERERPSQSPLECFLHQFESRVEDGVHDYWAVHTVGDFSMDELFQILATPPADAAGDKRPTAFPPVAYIKQLRVYSAACRGVGRNPTEISPLHNHPGGESLPAPLAALERLKFDHLTSSTTTRTSGNKSSDAEAAHFTFSELFGGIGMFRLGLERAGGASLFAVEVAPEARAVYAANFLRFSPSPEPQPLPTTSLPTHGVNAGGDTSTLSETTEFPFLGDITEIPSCLFPSHDLLTAGFPCQSFSKSGPATGLRHRKGWLFYEVVRVLRASRPKAFLLENVSNIVNLEGGDQLCEILSCLACPGHSTRLPGGEAQGEIPDDGRGKSRDDPMAGSHFTSSRTDASSSLIRYAVSYRVIDGSIVSPQTRQRVYFIGVRQDVLSHTISNDHPFSPSNPVDEIFNHALGLLAKAGHQAPYKCVGDLLIKHDLPGSRGGIDSGPPISSLVLTSTQWEAVQRSRTFRLNPQWRLVDVLGKARTLMGSYRTSFQLYSEFVPYQDPFIAQDALVAFLRAEVEAKTATSRNDYPEKPHDPTLDDAYSSRAAGCSQRAPLRFFSIRECARLQGIPDYIHFTMDGEGRGDLQDVTVHQRVLNPKVGEPLAMGGCARDSNHTRGSEASNAAPKSLVSPGSVYKLIGNAVNPIVVQCLAQSIANYVFAPPNKSFPYGMFSTTTNTNDEQTDSDKQPPSFKTEKFTD
ncbi:unnamed protein product [Phytomonas sp. Hart1]|nr:unnamed protein product [Phytomonas sp. Hart1]|eukprot:CCW70926.1 unnamed protein product [Phytomonas sp. isolate Hart1]